jgi:hypothetical protein
MWATLLREDYRLFEKFPGQAFVIRIKEDAVVRSRRLPLRADQAAEWCVTLGLSGGAGKEPQHARVWWRLGWRPTPAAGRNLRWPARRRIGHHLPPSLVHRIIFRWIKCILGCLRFLAESPRGGHQLYLALIAALLFQHYGGRRPNKRTWD